MTRPVPSLGPRSSRRDPRRGSVVIFVLGLILLAAFLITRLMDRAAVDLAAESKASKRADLRQEALSALEASLAVLADESAVRSGLHDPAEGWDRPLALMDYQPAAGYTVGAVVEDETGKLPLPVVDEEALGSFLTAIGCPIAAQERLVDALLAWTRPGYLSVAGDTGGVAFPGAILPYVAPQRALQSFEELRAIPIARELFFDEHGEWNELGRRFRSGASLFSFGTSNVNSASGDVLLARGVAEARVAALLAARADKTSRSSYRSTAELTSAWGRETALTGLGVEALCLHVVVTVNSGARVCRLEAWVQPGGARTVAPARRPAGAANEAVQAAASVRNNPRKRVDYPFQILELRENDGT